MRLKTFSGANRREAEKEINDWLSTKDITLMYQPSFFWVPNRKKWYCIIWYSGGESK